MPLRDHFRSPPNGPRSWTSFHAQWPGTIVAALNRRLPPQYIAEPRVYLGAAYEIDVAALDAAGPGRDGTAAKAGEDGGGVATATWAPPRPTLDVPTDLPGEDVYEVRVFDADWPEHVVAAVEIVSPGNKDRPESRRAFVAKCAALLRQGVSVVIVDLVTTRRANLYGELLELIGHADPALTVDAPTTYAAACRRRAVPGGPAERRELAWRFEAWAHALSVGRPLPTLPLWLAPDLAVPLELEDTYEETCQALRLR